jgi:hypothetical protein
VDQTRAGAQIFAVHTRMSRARTRRTIDDVHSHTTVSAIFARLLRNAISYRRSIRRHNIPRDRLPLCLRSLVLRNAIKILAVAQDDPAVGTKKMREKCKKCTFQDA